jgi:hypothetical protein
MMPEVVVNIGKAPYVIDSSIPQNRDEGKVPVIGLDLMSGEIQVVKSHQDTYANVTGLVNFVGSRPPNVISPFYEI